MTTRKLLLSFGLLALLTSPIEVSATIDATPSTAATFSPMDADSESSVRPKKKKKKASKRKKKPHCEAY